MYLPFLKKDDDDDDGEDGDDDENICPWRGGGERGVGWGIGGVISAPADLSIETMFKIVMGVCLWLDNCITLHGSAWTLLILIWTLAQREHQVCKNASNFLQ